jgi:hypothetical protein
VEHGCGPTHSGTDTNRARGAGPEPSDLELLRIVVDGARLGSWRMDPGLAREVWHRLETLNAVTYFCRECRDGPARLGLEGFWMGYFACRAAPMGAVGAGSWRRPSSTSTRAGPPCHPRRLDDRRPGGPPPRPRRGGSGSAAPAARRGASPTSRRGSAAPAAGRHRPGDGRRQAAARRQPGRHGPRTTRSLRCGSRPPHCESTVATRTSRC